jgi:hypothetical protein
MPRPTWDPTRPQDSDQVSSFPFSPSCRQDDAEGYHWDSWSVWIYHDDMASGAGWR